MRTPRWLQGNGRPGGWRQPPPSSLHSLFTLVALYGGKHTTFGVQMTWILILPLSLCWASQHLHTSMFSYGNEDRGTYVKGCFHN